MMTRGIIGRVLDPEQLYKWFDTTADQQYIKDLFFSTVFDIMSQAIRGSHSFVPAAYQAKKEDINVSIASVYNRLNGLETKPDKPEQQM